MATQRICPHCHRKFDAIFCPHDGRRLSEGPWMSMLSWEEGPLSGIVLKDRYQLLGKIGQGAMAAIYLAEDLQTGEPVAAKLLRIAGGPTRQRERFFQEVLVSSSVGHPAIVKIFDVGEREDRSPYIVMEYLRGETLGDLLRRQRTVAPAVALPLLAEVASALAAAHRAGVVHRDVKPDNIFLLGSPGEPYAAKLVDFGLAKSTLRLTAMGTAVGTAAFMAPEQALTDPIDGRSDIYALGIVFYVTFTGLLPFASRDQTELLAMQVTTPPPRPSLPQVLGGDESELSPELRSSAMLGHIIAKMLCKRPEHRYPSMEALIEDIERLLGKRHGSLEARRPLADQDIYMPKGPFAQIVIHQFYKLLGLPSPACLPPAPS